MSRNGNGNGHEVRRHARECAMLAAVKRPAQRRADVEESLEELALRSAEEAKRTRRPQLLPPLSPAERRLIHLALAEDPEIETESEGDGFLKRVAVRPKAS